MFLDFETVGEQVWYDVANIPEKNNVETVTMKNLFIIIPLFALVGCASSPSQRAEAASHTKPFIAALQAYHHKFGDYPQQLDDLRPRYLAADIPIYNNSDAKHSWFLGYVRIDENNYIIDLDSTPCSQAVFKDGTFVAGYGPMSAVTSKPASWGRIKTSHSEVKDSYHFWILDQGIFSAG